MYGRTIARPALLAVLALTSIAAADGPAWLDRLHAGEAEARAHFLEEGTPALAELRVARDAEKDAARRGRIAEVIAEIERREPHGLRFRVVLPARPPALAEANGPDFGFEVVVENRGTAAVVLLPYLALRIRDAEGADVATVRNLGRWGRRSANLLEEVRFKTIEPGGRWSVPVKLSHYGADPERILAWKLPAAGAYELAFTYRYVRAEWTRRCEPNWPALADPERPWNRAVEFTHPFTRTLRVR